MKNIVVLLVVCVSFFSCKEREIDGFDALSLKKMVSKDLDGSEWVANSANAYYDKIVFFKEVIIVSRGGTEEHLGYHVANVSAPMPEVPDVLLLRLKSFLSLNDIFLAKDYKTLESQVIPGHGDETNYFSDYRRIK